jgi:SAM-dependent methyltransferase
VNPAEHFYRHAIRFDDMFNQFMVPLRDDRFVRVEADLPKRPRRSTGNTRTNFLISTSFFEGIYLLKRQFQHHYDLSFWVQCSCETALQRSVARGQEGHSPAATMGYLSNDLLGPAHLAAGESVLDVGCGTGTLAIVAKGQVGADGKVFGIDASPAMVARASSKAAKAGVDVCFKTAVVERLRFPDARFDVVLSTLMLHHLPRKLRQQCAREIRRVLKPQGRVLVVDFGCPQPKSGFLAHFHRHGHVEPSDIVALLEDAELRRVDSGPVGISSLHFVLAMAGPVP